VGPVARYSEVGTGWSGLPSSASSVLRHRGMRLTVNSAPTSLPQGAATVVTARTNPLQSAPAFSRPVPPSPGAAQ
jgi:hypothetical protein